MEEIDINICIPNYNYGNYLDQTLNSLYAQEDKNFKVYISDNCSNDNSLDVIRKWSSKFVEFEWQQNESNIGFAGNLDAVGRMVKTGYMIMLSSDDMVLPRAVSDYKNLINHLNQSEYKKFVLGSLAIKVDEKGKEISLLEKDSKTWNENDIDPELSKTFGTTIYKVKANEMIRRCLTHFRTPLPFLSVCYPYLSYKKIGGYGGSRMMNPDKWFNWKILEDIDEVFLIEKPLFQYRWHNQNQTSLLKESGALKLWIDEYRNCFEIPNLLLEKGGMNKQDVENAFNTHILKYIAQACINGDKIFAKRLWHFAHACYPIQLRQNALYIRVSILYRLRNFISMFKKNHAV